MAELFNAREIYLVALILEAGVWSLGGEEAIMLPG